MGREGALDRDHLAGVLLRRLQAELGEPSLEYRRPPSPLHGGKFSAVFALDLAPVSGEGSRRLVARLLGSDPDRARLEAGLHDAAHGAGVRAPRVVVCEPDPSALGASYLVMERVDQRAYLRGVEPHRFAIDLPKLVAAWPGRFATVIAALGSVDPDEARRAIVGRGAADHLAEPGRHLRAVTAALAGEPALRRAVDWLHDNRPEPPPRLALVHGDLWPANVFVEDGAFCLVDWTRGGIDDPALDVGFAKVGFALMPEPFPPPPPIGGLVGMLGSSIARRISSHCDDLVGGTERVRYYEALRCAIELAGVVADREAGRRVGWEHGVPALTRHLERIVGEPVPFS